MRQSGPDPSDETLMAYADGQLPEPEVVALEALLERDAGAAQRLEAFRATRLRLRDAAADQRDVPAALRASVEGMIADHHAARAAPNVTPLADRRGLAGSVSRAWPSALAASLGLAVGLGAGLLLRGGSDLPDDAGSGVLALLPDADIAPLLDTQASGQTAQVTGGDVTFLASFLDGADRLCREVEVSVQSVGTDAARFIAVVCRDTGTGWNTEFALRLETADGFAPAGGLEPLATYLDVVSAGPVLSDAAEADALAGR